MLGSMTRMELDVRTADVELIAAAWQDEWGAPLIVSVHRDYAPGDVEGFAAYDDGQLAALVTWAQEGDEAEIVSLDAMIGGKGYGRALLHRAEAELWRRGVRRLLLVTTNDNVNAISMYLRDGWRVVAVHLDDMDRVRAKKPAIPLIGLEGIPLRDMWELEKLAPKA